MVAEKMKIMSEYTFSDLVDIDEFSLLLKSFYKATGIPNGIVGNDGELITQAGWTAACNTFHRGHPKSNQRCRESNLTIMQELHEGEVASSLCMNGLIDYATPVVINGCQLATLFLGQVLTEPPDMDFFRKQAAGHGYNEDAYLAAIRAVPVVSKKQMELLMQCMVGMAQVLAGSGLARMDQKALKQDLNLITEERIQLEGILDSFPVGISLSGEKGKGGIKTTPSRPFNLFLTQFRDIIGISFSKDEYPDDKKRLHASIGFHVQVIYMAIWSSYIIFYLILGSYISAGACFLGSASAISGILVLRFKKNVMLSGILSNYGAVTALFILSLPTGGPISTGIVWQIGVLIGTFLQLGKKPGYIIACYVIALHLAILILHFSGIQLNNELPVILQSDWYSLVNIMICTVAITYLISIFTKQFEIAYRALSEAETRALEASHAKSEFLANMSHEIRTPLNAVIGFSGLLSSLVGDQRQKSYLSAIKTAGKNLLILINDILDLSKIEADKLEINYSAFDLRRVLNEIEQMFNLQAADKKLVLKIFICDDLPAALFLDEIRLRQVLFNIVGNAVKFTEKGEISIGVKIKDKKEDRLDIIMSVKDSGIGIAEDEIESIFESFKQQTGQDTTRFGGTGLGLAISKRLVEMMNGHISVQSRKGKGSIFKIQIHDVLILDQNPLALDEDATIEQTRFEKGRVLIVDDVQSNRDLLGTLLEKMNLEVKKVADGQACIDAVADFKPDLILMDIRMPVMDGIQATYRLKKDPNTQTIPIIAVTASSSLSEKDQILEKGFDDFLSKPFEMGDLIQVLSIFFNKIENRELKNKRQSAWDLENFDLDSPAAKKSISRALCVLESDFMTQWQMFEKKQPMAAVKQFGQDLKILGRKYKLDFLVEYSNELITHVDYFDISHIQRMIRAFPQMIQTLKQIREKTHDNA